MRAPLRTAHYWFFSLMHFATYLRIPRSIGVNSSCRPNGNFLLVINCSSNCAKCVHPRLTLLAWLEAFPDLFSLRWQQQNCLQFCPEASESIMNKISWKNYWTVKFCVGKCSSIGQKHTITRKPRIRDQISPITCRVCDLQLNRYCTLNFSEHDLTRAGRASGVVGLRQYSNIKRKQSTSFSVPDQTH